MNVITRKMVASDWAQVKKIYRQGLDTGLANFSENPPSWQGWDESHLEIGRIVACDLSGDVLGWGALSPVGGN